jgi:hypothetical protein
LWDQNGFDCAHFIRRKYKCRLQHINKGTDAEIKTGDVFGKRLNGFVNILFKTVLYHWQSFFLFLIFSSEFLLSNWKRLLHFYVTIDSAMLQKIFFRNFILFVFWSEILMACTIMVEISVRSFVQWNWLFFLLWIQIKQKLCLKNYFSSNIKWFISEFRIKIKTKIFSFTWFWINFHSLWSFQFVSFRLHFPDWIHWNALQWIRSAIISWIWTK